MKNTATVKNTFNLTVSNYQELKRLVDNNFISSMTEGVNLGIELLVIEMRKKSYYEQMKKAALDKDYIQRTVSSQKDFDNLYDEVPGEW